MEDIPFEVTGWDFDNGTEFLNKAVIAWAADMEIFFTRARPYKRNDQATIESKNNYLVGKYGFYYRYDTDEEQTVLNRRWTLVDDRFNYLTPATKPVGFGTDRDDTRSPGGLYVNWCYALCHTCARLPSSARWVCSATCS